MDHVSGVFLGSISVSREQQQIQAERSPVRQLDTLFFLRRPK